MLAQLLILKCVITGALASLWPDKRMRSAEIQERSWSGTRDRSAELHDISSLLQSHESLEKYAHRSDCFLKAANMIRSRCGDLEMNEPERVDAAIRMTLCELSTASHPSVPMECMPFTARAQLVEDHSSAENLRGSCVDAFARSAQFWSSYSGYLREVPQLCFAFRRWNDIDTAREIYRNITLESSTLLRQIFVRESDFEQALSAFHQHLEALEAYTSRIDSAAEGMNAIPDRFRLLVDQSREEILGLFGNQMATLAKAHETRELSVLNQVGAALELITQKHSDELISLLLAAQSILGNGLSSAISQAQSSLHFHVDRLAINLNSIDQTIFRQGKKLENLTELVSRTSSSTADMLSLMDLATQETGLLREDQRALHSELFHLGSMISNLSAKALEEQERFANVSSMMIERALRGSTRSFLAMILEWSLLCLFKVDAASLERVWDHAAFRVFTGGVFWLVRTFASSAIAILVVCLSWGCKLPNLLHSNSHRTPGIKSEDSPNRLVYPNPPSFGPTYTQARPKRTRVSRISQRLLRPC